MTRHSIVAWLGLLGCVPRGSASAPEPATEPTARRSTTPTPTPTPTPSSTSPPSQVWCGATIDTRPRTVLRTRSVLLALQELRRVNVPRAPTPALDEGGARSIVCGTATCTPSSPRAVELFEGSESGIGTIVDLGGGELLAIPDISPFTTNHRCASSTQLSSATIGPFLHLWSDVEFVRYYHHHHGGYEVPYRGYYCQAPAGRRELVIDTRSDEIVVDIHHGDTALSVVPALHEGALALTLSGCSGTLELQWTSGAQG